MPVTFARQQDQLRGGLTAEQANFCGSPSEGPTCPCRLSWSLSFYFTAMHTTSWQGRQKIMSCVLQLPSPQTEYTHECGFLVLK